MTGMAKTALSAAAIGSRISLKENGIQQEFIVLKHDYESGLNGSGRTLVCRAGLLGDCGRWDYTDATTDLDWSKAELRAWLTGTYLTRFEESTRTLIGTTKYVYQGCQGGSYVENYTVSDAVFILSAKEMGGVSWSNMGSAEDGTALSDEAIAAVKSAVGANGVMWTRSTSSQSYQDTENTSYEWHNRIYILQNGMIGETSDHSNRDYDTDSPDNAWTLPCFTLPGDTEVSNTGEVNGNGEPIITGDFVKQSELGVRRSAFSIGYAVNDEDGDQLTVRELIDGNEIRAYLGELGKTMQFEVTKALYDSLDTDSYHTLTVEVSDETHTVTASVTFLKTLQNGYKAWIGEITGSGEEYYWTKRECLYDPLKQDDNRYVVTSPTAELEKNDPGSFEFSMPPGHVYYSNVKLRKTVVSIEQDGLEIWMGYVTEISKDFDGWKDIYCTGELGYLSDNGCRIPASTYTVSSLMAAALNIHSNLKSEGKSFSRGTVTMVSSISIDLSDAGTQYTNSWDAMTTNLTDEYGGYLKVRKTLRRSGDVTYYRRYLDYLEEIQEKTEQAIAFGTNLLDLDYYLKANGIVNTVTAYGYTTTGWWIFEKTTPISVTETDAASVALYGTVVQYIVVDGKKSTTETLRTAAKKALREGTGGLSAGITINALDLRNAGVDTDRLSFLKKTQVISPPHGINDWLPCTKLHLPLANLDDTDFTFGDSSDSISQQQKNVLGSAGRAWSAVKSAISYINGNGSTS